MSSINTAHVSGKVCVFMCGRSDFKGAFSLLIRREGWGEAVAVVVVGWRLTARHAGGKSRPGALPLLLQRASRVLGAAERVTSAEGEVQ